MVTLDRVVCKPDELKREHEVEGTDIKIALAGPAELEARQEANIQQGYIMELGELAYKRYNLSPEATPAVGDFVMWVKYSGVGFLDPETMEKRVLLNDEDVVLILKKGNK